MTDLPKRYSFDAFVTIMLDKLENDENLSFYAQYKGADNGLYSCNYYKDSKTRLIFRSLRNSVTDEDESTIALKDITSFRAWLLGDLMHAFPSGSITLRAKDSGDGQYYVKYGKEYVIFFCRVGDVVLPPKPVKQQMLARFEWARPKPAPAWYPGHHVHHPTAFVQRNVCQYPELSI